jgi:hypothetical protein
MLFVMLNNPARSAKDNIRSAKTAHSLKNLEQHVLYDWSGATSWLIMQKVTPQVVRSIQGYFHFPTESIEIEADDVAEV